MNEHELVPPATRHSIEDVDTCVSAASGDALDELQILARMPERYEIFSSIVSLGETDAEI